MKKVFIALCLICSVSLHAKENKTSELTEQQKLQQQLEVLSQRRQQYLKELQGIDIEIIATQAILNYVNQKEKENSGK